MSIPDPTLIYRLLHVDNLRMCLRRGALHAPNCTPQNGLIYKTIHNVDIQEARQATRIPCGPGGVIHDYVSFYFGPRSPMLFQLHTGWNIEYEERQDPLIYLVSTAQVIHNSGAAFVFSNGHGIAVFTNWFDQLEDLSEVDWAAVYADYWRDDVNDMDRQRRKQAEFLVHQQCDWDLIQEIGVAHQSMKSKVEGILAEFAAPLRRPVRIRPEWYY